MGEINLKDYNKADILAALYNGSRVQGLWFLQAEDGLMDKKEAEELLKTQTYFDYLKGKVMKIDLSGDILYTNLYNRDNGENAAERIIENI